MKVRRRFELTCGIFTSIQSILYPALGISTQEYPISSAVSYENYGKAANSSRRELNLPCTARAESPPLELRRARLKASAVLSTRHRYSENSSTPPKTSLNLVLNSLTPQALSP